MKTGILTIAAGLGFAIIATGQILPIPQVAQDISNINRSAEGTVYYAQLWVQATTCSMTR